MLGRRGQIRPFAGQKLIIWAENESIVPHVGEPASLFINKEMSIGVAPHGTLVSEF